MKTRYLIAAAMMAAATPALAGPLTISNDLRVEKRVAARDGTTRIVLQKATNAVPGDRMVVVLTYRNTGRQPIADVVLANPVPKGTAYRAPAPGSSQGSSPMPELSADGSTFGTLDSLRVRTVAGATRAASADDVTAVRWRLTSPVPAGGQGQVSFQAVLK